MTALHLRLPTPGWGIREATITRWHRHPGAPIAPGDVIVELAGFERLRNQGTENAVKLLSNHWTAGATGDAYDRLRVEVIAEEAGWLQQVATPEGSKVAVGEVMATVSSTPPTGAVGSPAPSGDPALDFRAQAEVAMLDEDFDAG